MELPTCKDCNQNDMQRLMDETDECWTFCCMRCKTVWIVSKPRTQGRALLSAQAERLKRVTDAERASLARTKYFDLGRRK